MHLLDPNSPGTVLMWKLCILKKSNSYSNDTFPTWSPSYRQCAKPNQIWKKELEKLKSRIDTGAGFRLGLSKIYVVMWMGRK